MSQTGYRGLVLSDFNAANFSGCLEGDGELPAVTMTAAPFGQLMPALLHPDFECWRSNPDFAVVWTLPQGVSRAFGRLARYEPASVPEILAEVEEFAGMVKLAAGRVKFLLVVTWTAPSCRREFGLLDLKKGLGITQALWEMNARLLECLEGSGNVYLLNGQRWVELAGRQAFSPKLWYMGKIPFGNDVFLEAARDVKAAVNGLFGGSRKLVLVDLDDTLWGGIVGDVGWEGLSLGGHDPRGEAYVEFQRALQALTRRGVLLGIVSKNDEATALGAIHDHPEMVLKQGDFAGWRINWRDKAENILELVKQLNLGLQSVVFIDDNPVERARVREALPEVLVPDWPEDPRLYESTLQGLRCFNPPSLSREDAERTKLYQLDRQREEARQAVSSVEEWLQSLGVTVTVEQLQPGNLQRVAQLLNKTNQMNLSTRRLTEQELIDWTREPSHRLWVFRVSDKFGDSGITGIASLENGPRAGTIVDFILSCRVMGRKVEETMIYTILSYARAKGLERVTARYLPTEKNRPCLEFWQKSGFACEGEQVFSWSLADAYAKPKSIALEGDLG